MNVLHNNNGETYTVLSQIGNNYLLLTPSEGSLIVAESWDEENQSWAYGNYYRNTLEDLIRASRDLMRISDPEKSHQDQVEILRETPYEELFRALAEYEDPALSRLSEEEWETVFEGWDKYGTHQFLDMQDVYQAASVVGIDLTPQGMTAAADGFELEELE